jgi:chemotaxis protein methyltransferase CheR
MNDLEYNYIKHQIHQLTGIDLNAYKSPQMQRRLQAYLLRIGYPNWPKFFKTLRTDPGELKKLKDYLTINVSAFFRDQEKYKFLQTVILPELLRQHATLRVWSAGCARGQEAYSIAMLLANPEVEHHIMATDVDQSALDWAKAGGPYTPDDITNVPSHLRLRYLEARQNQFWVTENLRHQVTFRQHNLLGDPIAGKFDLIICRNVVIYFQSDAKDKLYRDFYQALKPGGVLFVGGTEIVPKAGDIGFEAMNVSFYRRRSPTLAINKPKLNEKLENRD